MKTIRTFSFFVSLILLSTFGFANLQKASVRVDDFPAKTVFIKHPAAANLGSFFSTGTVFEFYVYKPGAADQLNQILDTFKKYPAVASCMAGQLNGDYQAIQLTLKSAKDKAWFIAVFKKAGLHQAKINNGPVTATEKL